MAVDASTQVTETSGLSAPILTLTGVSKRFPGVRALHNVNLNLRAGEVTALIGENGAGKSTLVKILTGIYQPDEGEIVVSGAPFICTGPRDAWAAGIAAIHQETVMFDELSVAENIFMGHMPLGAGGRIDWAAMRSRTAELLKRLEADFDANTLLKRLSVAQKHLVEIARALSHDARIIIMDEPTSALSAREIGDLFAIIAQLKRRNCAILFISHKFDEIFHVADRWTCLRDGEEVGHGAIADVAQADLVRLMVGRSIEQVYPKRDVKPGPVVLEAEDLANASEFDGVSFQLRAGQIIGLYGLVGAGRSEAMQGLFGLSPLTRGRVKIDGREAHIRSPADAIRAGLAYVPEDRQIQGVVLPFGIRANMTLASLKAHARDGFLSLAKELQTTKKFGGRLAVKAANWEQKLGELSGGNQQKVVIGKWLASGPRILILDEPTKGIDIGSKAAVHEFMGELASEGIAIILVSSELPEIMGLADEIMVMHEGRVVQRFARGQASAEMIVSAAIANEDAEAPCAGESGEALP
ncbi:sugar ABC transporter ATP-binding protein [Methylocapsa sp. S129]|uniref:sugar ABC transporter ATP-binding protein n=1 Tax=Methylocapsa sp. S129 TaxID=1641869 RepID=UPI00131C7F82|nr:sugar ABC transporter ATP-binding protein [Methylocapsa sp. S129]